MTTVYKLLQAVCVIVIAGCSRASSYVPEPSVVEVEVAPDKFIEVTRWDWTADDPRNRSGVEKSRLSFDHSGKEVSWEGASIPVVLRERGGVYYLAGYDRDAQPSPEHRGVLHFYEIRSGGSVEIHPGEFPKDLATQNMWTNDRNRKAILECDTSSYEFRSSVNAMMWSYLMTGEADAPSFEKCLLDDYAETYRPDKLKWIQKPKSHK